MYLQKYTILATTILLQSVLLSKLHCQLLASRILNFAKTARKQPQAKILRGIFCHVEFFRIRFLWVFVTCWVAVIAVLQKYLAGLSKNGLGTWQQRHQRFTTTQHALRLSSSVKNVLMLRPSSEKNPLVCFPCLLE